MIVLSAKTPAQLRDQVAQLREAIRQGRVNAANLANAAYTLQVGRAPMEERLATSVASIEELDAKLAAVLAGDTSVERLYRGQVKRNKDELALFAADDDMAATLEAWVQKGKHHKLLELWAKGLEFDWNRLYHAQRPQRMSLPTYPFAAEHYWVPQPAASAPRAAVQAAGQVDGFDHEYFARLLQDLDSDVLSVDGALAKARSKI